MKMKTIYHQAKKTVKFDANLLQALLLAVLVAMLFWSPVRASLAVLIIKGAEWIYPERAEKSKSLSEVLLLGNLKNLKEENDRFRESLNLKNKIVRPAKLILDGGYLFADALVLNEGEEAGIKKGDIVFTPENILVGRVAEVWSGRSKVRPISALGEKTVLRGGSNKALIFEAEGRGLGEMKSELPSNLNLRLGEILWWGEDPRMIAALTDKINRTESSPFSDVIMLSPLRFFSVSDVLVISPWINSP